MPEGHTVHRLAHAFAELFGGQRLAVSSPQGRFADGAALLDGHALVGTEAHGKQLFLAFAPAPDAPADGDGVRWLRVHLGLYGSWTFAGDETFRAPHAIGAPRRRVGEEEVALARARTSPRARRARTRRTTSCAIEDADDARRTPGAATGTRPRRATAGTRTRRAARSGCACSARTASPTSPGRPPAR